MSPRGKQKMMNHTSVGKKTKDIVQQESKKKKKETRGGKGDNVARQNG